MDPIGRCILIEFILLALCAMFTFGASQLNVLRAPDEESTDEKSAKLYQKRNTYRYRILASRALVIIIAGVILGITDYEKFADASAAAIVITVIFAVLFPVAGIYLPTAAAEHAPRDTFSRLSLFAKNFALIGGVFAALSRSILKLFGIKPDMLRLDVTEEEILQLVDEGEFSGALNSEEREMIANIFDFGDRSVHEVMTHYMDVCAIPEGTPDDEIVKIISETEYSRYPIYRDDIGSVCGVLIAKDFLLNRLSPEPKSSHELVREPFFVPETMQTDDVLREMKEKKEHMAIAVNEYGEACGIVTMEDLLEEIVGSIYDESDTPDDREPEIRKIDENVWLAHASCPLEELEEEIGVTLEEIAEVDTLGSLVFSCLTTIPDDHVPIDVETAHLLLHSDGLEERRLEWVRVELKVSKDEQNTVMAKESKKN